MSEVKRYEINGTFEAPETGEKWVNPKMVLESDFDRVTAERDALQVLLTAADEENDALKHWRDLALQFDNHRMKALWHLKTLVSDGAHYDAAAAFLAEPPVPASDLQQRLTAADERVDVLEGLLLQTNELLYAIQGDPGAVPSSSIDAMRGRVFEALKPAEVPYAHSGEDDFGHREREQ